MALSGAIDTLMGLGPWARFYGASTLVVLILSLIVRYPGTRRAAGFLAAYWLAYNLARPNLGLEDLGPLVAKLDFVGILVGLSLFARLRKGRWHDLPDRWAAVFILGFLAEMIACLWLVAAGAFASPIFYWLANMAYFATIMAAATPSLSWLWRRRAHPQPLAAF